LVLKRNRQVSLQSAGTRHRHSTALGLRTVLDSRLTRTACSTATLYDFSADSATLSRPDIRIWLVRGRPLSSTRRYCHQSVAASDAVLLLLMPLMKDNIIAAGQFVVLLGPEKRDRDSPATYTSCTYNE